MKSLLLRLFTVLGILASAQPRSAAQCGVQISAGNISPVYYVAGCIGSGNIDLYDFVGGSRTYQWQYKSTASGSFGNISGATGSVFSPTVSGYYRMFVSTGSCSGYTDSVEVSVATTIPAVISPSSTTVCAGSPAVKLYLPGVVGRYDFYWYRGTTLITGDTTCFAGISGTYHCVVSDHTTSCTGTSPGVTISFSTPAAPAVSSPVSYCQNATAIPLTATGSNLNWYTAATGGTASSTPPTPSTSIARNDTFYVSQTTGSCEGPRAMIVVEVLPLPAAPVLSGAPLRYCLNATASQLSVTGTSLKWYTGSTGGTASLTAPTPSTATAGVDTFYVTETVGSCESPRGRIPVEILPLPAAPIPAVAGSGVCPGDTIYLTASGALASRLISWTGPGGFTDTGVRVQLAAIAASDTGFYSVRVTDTFGCVSPYDSVRLSIYCPDSVWPGDVNLDKTVDHLDALRLALAIGSLGPARVGGTMLWQPELCAPWAQAMPGLSLVNRKHADCDGDGVAAFSDTLAISANYGLVHLRRAREPHAKSAGVPVLYFDLSAVQAVEGTTISIPVMFGSAASQVSGIAGIAAGLELDGLIPATAPELSFAGSWLSGAPMLQFGKIRSNAALDWVYARADQTVASGGGRFATLKLELPDGTAGSLLKLHLGDVLVVDASGMPFLDYTVLDDSIRVVSPVGIRALRGERAAFSIAPNPSNGACVASVRLPEPGSFTIEILDLSGRLVGIRAGRCDAGEQRVLLPTDGLGAGVYMIQLRDGSGISPVPKMWIRL